MQLLGRGGTGIGFCIREFLLEDKFLGWNANSIGIRNTAGIFIDGFWNKFGKAVEFFFH